MINLTNKDTYKVTLYNFQSWAALKRTEMPLSQHSIPLFSTETLSQRCYTIHTVHGYFCVNMDQSSQCATDFPKATLSVIKQFKASLGILTDGKKSKWVKAFWYLLPFRVSKLSAHICLIRELIGITGEWLFIDMCTEGCKQNGIIGSLPTGNRYWPFFIFGRQPKYDTACAREALHLAKVKLQE